MATEEINIKVKSDISETTKDASGLASEFRIMGVSLNDVKKGLASVGMMAKKSFATIKAGIASTGIGLLVIAFGSLVQYFKDSEEGASKFKQITSQLGVVVGNVTDIVSNLGKSVFKLVTGDFKGFADGLKEVAADVKDFGETTRKEMKQANQLEKDRLALQKFEREAIVEKARTEKEMMKLRLQARDFEKFSAEERLGFMREANKLAAEQLQKDLHVAKEKLRFQQEENSFSKSTQENLDAEAQLQAQVFQIERSNFSERKRMKSEEQAIVKEIASAESTRLKEAEDLKKKKEKEDEEARKKKEEEEEKARKKKEEEDKKAAAREIAITESVNSAKLALTKQAFGALGQLAGENEALGKGVAIAETIFNTQQGIMAAMGATSVADKLLPFPMRLANAALVGIMGANAIKNIMSAKRTGGGGGGAVAGGGAPAPQMTSGAFDLSGVNAPEPVQAYVVTDDMTNSQNKLETIRRRATI